MENKNGINTNSNAYIIAYASVLVVVVAFLLAFIYMSLKERSDANVEIDKKSQILAALNIRDIDKDSITAVYSQNIVNDQIIDSAASVVNEGADKDKAGFKLSTKDVNNQSLPLYICNVNGATKYIIPLSGKGLWGPIWGYIALNNDKETVYGAYFNHESETAGLGARITETEFQNEFINKKVSKDGKFVTVVKYQTVKDADIECDGISGATKTSNFVGVMLSETLSKYSAFLNKK